MHLKFDHDYVSHPLLFCLDQHCQAFLYTVFRCTPLKKPKYLSNLKLSSVYTQSQNVGLDMNGNILILMKNKLCYVAKM